RPRGVADRRREGGPGGAEAPPSPRPEGRARPAPPEGRTGAGTRAREGRRRRPRPPPGGPRDSSKAPGVGLRRDGAGRTMARPGAPHGRTEDGAAVIDPRVPE